jgi:alkylation response protein AidB-like acyl-CoA dehydrogenase
MVQLGWLGLVFPERYGGAGLDRVDLAVLLEEMGRVLVPAPFFSTVVLGGGAIVVAGSEEQKRDLLPRVAAGELRLSLAQLESDGRWDVASIELPARSTAGGYSLSGRKLFVPDAGTAHRLVVLARCEAGLTLFLVECETPGVAIRQIDYVDRTRPLFEVTFDDARVEREAILGGIGLAESLLEEVHDLARAALCAEMCGGAQRVLDLSLAHAKSREQFGRPIGSFQAISHKCADMFVKVESTRSAAYYAAWSLAAADPEAHMNACMAKAFCAEAYAKVAAEGIQIHGGLGFTWEHDLHLFYKRAKACEVALGDVAWTRERAARVLIDEPTRAQA